jgi:uncharacterized protein (DUF58 family)
MSLRQNALLLVLLTAVLAMVGDWGGADHGLAGLWRLPAAFLLLGLAYESWTVSRSSLSFDLELPERLFLGRSLAVRFVFRHDLRRHLDIEVAPSAPDSFELDAEVMPLRVPPGAPVGLVRRASPSRLGEHSWPSMRTRMAGRLGLAWWPKELACGRQVRVLPDLFCGENEVKGLAASGAKAGPQGGAGAEVMRLRDYRAGDPPRVLDWKATARTGRLISRDFAQDQRLQIVIAVDAGRASALRAGSLDRFGHYVNIAARLAQHAVARDDLVGLVVYADRPLAALAPARGTQAVVRLRAVLAAARVERTESNPLFAAARVRALVRHRSIIVMLTDVDDATAASQLVQAVGLLSPKHLTFVAGLSSAAVEAMSQAPATHWLDPYRALAAQEYRIGLERKVRALNALGAPALVARPEQLERAVFAAYENLRRGRRA